MPRLPGGLFLTDPYQLCAKNTPRGDEAPGKEMQSAPSARIRWRNSDDCKQEGKAGGPGPEREEMKRHNECSEGIPYDPIEAFGRDVVEHVPRRKGVMGENCRKDKTVGV